MSWNLIIYKTDRTGGQIEPLGDLDRVTNALNGAFIALEWESLTAAELPADVDGGFRVNLTMQDGKVQDIHTDGGFNHLREFAGLCTREGWRMADAQEGEDVNLRDPLKWYQERSARETGRPVPSRPASPLPVQGQRPADATSRRSSRILEWVIWLLVLVGLGLLAFFLWRRNT
jgi:hypothetical protein